MRIAMAAFTPPSSEKLGGFRQSDGGGNVEDGPAKDRVVQATDAFLHNALFPEDCKCHHKVHVASKVATTSVEGRFQTNA